MTTPPPKQLPLFDEDVQEEGVIRVGTGDEPVVISIKGAVPMPWGFMVPPEEDP
jgi:hypothetical protein